MKQTERLVNEGESTGMLDPQEVGKAVVSLIQGRRSIREQFINREIPNEIVEEIIESGLRAPSSKHAQPWRLHVVADKSKLSHIAHLVEHTRNADEYAPIDPSSGELREWSSTVSLSAGILKDVNLGIFVENSGPFSNGRESIVTADIVKRRGSIESYTFEVIGLGAMIENMWLTAEARGVSGVFLADVVVAENQIKNHLGLEGDLVGALALGYSEQKLPKRTDLEPGKVVYHDALIQYGDHNDG